jgi:hypothetical protein
MAYRKAANMMSEQAGYEHCSWENSKSLIEKKRSWKERQNVVFMGVAKTSFFLRKV